MMRHPLIQQGVIQLAEDVVTGQILAIDVNLRGVRYRVNDTSMTPVAVALCDMVRGTLLTTLNTAPSMGFTGAVQILGVQYVAATQYVDATWSPEPEADTPEIVHMP